ncbi:hypothetical protein EM20IM_03830 [Candidatus Methylacidiphilum infernorum]|uniref:Uncharacterized protein n=1 Tax=Candidatus Methylacidiphilum infernorum TaxID=511746 RepID=A0ABX7PX33_9BACT|nr:hypothetical protein [Candidatus Methylacidiphilum infernorum]QSR87462.1 hypothetical protein EM20IM_03830 [Candidatus Methylacidiphilum infernorum]
MEERQTSLFSGKNSLIATPLVVLVMAFMGFGIIGISSGKQPIHCGDNRLFESIAYGLEIISLSLYSENEVFFKIY